MASDTDAPEESAKHFKATWGKMQKLTERFQRSKESKGPHGEDISPRGPIKDRGFQSLDDEFTQMCLNFVWPKLRS